MKRILLASTVAGLLAASPAWAQVKLELVEVITSPQRTEVLQGLVDEYTAANPGIEVEIISLPWGQAFEKFATMVSAGQTPDLVEMPDRWLSLYATNGALENLEPYLSSWSDTGELTDKALQFGRYVNDTAYMLPYGFYLRALFYNKKLFEEAGVDGPPETMEDFMEASRAVSALDGKSGYCLRGGPGGLNGWIMMSAIMNGSNSFFDEDGNSTLDQPGSVEGIQFLLDIYQKGYAPQDSVNWGFNEIVAGFYSGTCAMLDQDPDALIAIAERMNADDYAVAPMPKGPAGKSFPTIGYAGWAMFADSEHKQETWDLIAHLSNRDSNLVWNKTIGALPIHVGANDDPFYNTPQFEGWFTTLNEAAWEPTTMPTYLPEFAFFADSLALQSAQDALLGNKSAEELAAEWASYLTDAQQKWLSQQ